MRDLNLRVWNKYSKKMEYTDKEGWSMIADCYLTDSEFDRFVMLYAGVKDRNGREIYEGDILKGKTDDYINGFLSPVDFYAGSFHVTIPYDLHMIPLSGFDTVWVKNGCRGDEETSLWIDEFEIVGNIYETANLLKRVEKNKRKS